MIPLDAETHRLQGWMRMGSLLHTAQDACCPIVLAEVGEALLSCPIAFRERAGAFELVAVQGLREGENFLVDGQGRWCVSYIPSIYRGYPFAVQDVRVGEEVRRVLCFDEKSGLLCMEPDPGRGDRRFFDDEGNLQPDVQKIAEFLGRRQGSAIATDLAVKALAEGGLLVPWELPKVEDEVGAKSVEGLFRFSEAGLKSLGGEALKKLVDSSALAAGYSQLFSMPRVAVLLHFWRLRRPKAVGVEDLPASLDSFFKKGTASETLSFEWLKDREP